MSEDKQSPGSDTGFGLKFLFGFLGGGLGMLVGYALTGDPIEHASWTTSIIGGIGCATGFTLASVLFGKKQ